ncbi:MAG: hypothetical protein ABR510_01965 [Trueperaceae bacterium]
MNQSSNPSARHRAAVAVLVVVAAVVHFLRAAADPHITVLFTLNGLGFLTLLAGVLFAPPRIRRIVRWVLVAYAGATAGLYVYWAAFGDGEWLFPYGPISFVAEVLLIMLLVRQNRREAKPAT